MELTRQEAKDLLAAVVFNTTACSWNGELKDRKRLVKLIPKIKNEIFKGKPKLNLISKPTIIELEDESFYVEIEKYVTLPSDDNN